MDHGFTQKQPCTNPDRWSKVKGLLDIKSLPSREFQIFTYHCMECPTHENILNSFEDILHSHLESVLTSSMGIKLSF